MRIPTEEECFKILEEHNLPENIIAHSKSVCRVALDVADKLAKTGVKLDRDLVIAGALLHDITRLDEDHAKSGADLLEGLGLKRVAKIVRIHGLWHYGENGYMPETIEEKIVFYADKRVVRDKIVSLEERFKYLKQRYKTEDKLYHYAKNIEKELLG